MSVWYGNRLPFRDTVGNYERWPYETLPPCPKEHEFTRFRTISDLKEEYQKKDCCLPMNSPNSAYFDFDDERNIFYRDQQDCVIWCLDDKGVYIYGTNKVYVAQSLGEFLWRIRVEDACWYRYRYTEIFDERELIHGRVSLDLNDECDQYINHYFNLYKKTREYLLSANVGCTEKNIDAYLAFYTFPGSVDDPEKNCLVLTQYLKYFDQLEEEGILEIRNSFLSGLELGAVSKKRLNELISEN